MAWRERGQEKGPDGMDSSPTTAGDVHAPATTTDVIEYSDVSAGNVDIPAAIDGDSDKSATAALPVDPSAATAINTHRSSAAAGELGRLVITAGDIDISPAKGGDVDRSVDTAVAVDLSDDSDAKKPLDIIPISIDQSMFSSLPINTLHKSKSYSCIDAIDNQPPVPKLRSTSAPCVITHPVASAHDNSDNAAVHHDHEAQDSGIESNKTDPNLLPFIMREVARRPQREITNLEHFEKHLHLQRQKKSKASRQVLQSELTL